MKIVVLFLLLLVSTFSVCAQSINDIEDFHEFAKTKSIYYDSLYIANGGQMQGTGYTPFVRFVTRWQDVAYNDNGIQNSISSYQQYISRKLNDSIVNQYRSNTIWQELGPVTAPKTNYYSNVQSNGVGRINFIEFDPNDPLRVFAGSPTGGLWVSNDYGETWENGGTDQLPVVGVSHIQLPSGVQNTWFIITGDADGNFVPTSGIFRTTDGGASWVPINSGLWNPFPSYFVYGRRLLINPSNGNELYVTLDYGLFRTQNALNSTPSSVTWTSVIDETKLHVSDPDYINNTDVSGMSIYIQDVFYKPGSNNNTMYASGESVFVSTDNGDNWQELPGMQSIRNDDPYNDDIFVIRTTQDDPDLLYVIKYYQNCGIKGPDRDAKMYKYKYSDNSWISLSIDFIDYGLLCGRSESFAVSPIDKNHVLVSNVYNVYESYDGGITWSELPKQYHDDKHWISYGPNSIDLWLGTDGGINRSTDGGDTWVDLTNNIGVANMHAISAGSVYRGSIIYGGYDTGTSVFSSSTNTWSQIHGGDAFRSAIDDRNKRSYVSSAYSPVILRNFFSSQYYIAPPHSTNWWMNFVVEKHDSKRIYAVTKEFIYRSYYDEIDADGDGVLDPTIMHEDISAPAFDYWHPKRKYYNVWNSMNHKEILYVLRITNDESTDNDGFALLKSTNCNVPASAVTFQDVSPIINGSTYRGFVSDLAVDENDPNKFWVVYSGYANSHPKIVYFDGNQCQNLTDPIFDDINVRSIAIDPTNNIVYLGTTDGVYYTYKDNPVNWIKMDGLPNVEITDIDIDNCSNKIRAATFGRGLWEANLVVIIQRF